LQIDDDLAAVVKAQRDHAAGALVVDVGVRFIIDAVASTFYRLQNGFGQVQVFELGNYNPIMFALLLRQTRILGRRALAPLQGLRPATAERLAQTLRSWLLHQGQRDAVAADLFVHAQTVRYRMNQVRELYGDRLSDPQTILELTVALGIAGTG
jgi:sugar diacid utilization regulator